MTQLLTFIAMAVLGSLLVTGVLGSVIALQKAGHKRAQARQRYPAGAKAKPA